MKRGFIKKVVACVTALAMTLTVFPQSQLFLRGEKAEAAEGNIQLSDDDIKSLYQKKSNSRVTVHDPSIIKVGTQYYIHGTQQSAATTADLVDWTQLDFSQTTTKTMYTEDLETIFVKDKTGAYNVDAYFRAYGQANGVKWEVPGNLWAPDIIYNPDMGKYCMYLSLNGRVWNTVVVLLTSDKIDGPFEYVGPVVFSGFTDGNVAATGDASTDNTNAEAAKYTNTDLKKVLDACDSTIDNKDSDGDGLPDRYDGKIVNVKGVDDRANTYGTYLPHAIDPAVFYDESGTLWMTYGSWSGGIYILKLDGKTGLRDYQTSYNLTYSNSSNAGTITSDPYFGKKIAGGFYVSGEGPYIEKIGKYYYLFMSYGFYDPTGGYEMRIFRSENPDGPYVDSNGEKAIYDKYQMNYGPGAATNRGEKLMGNYQWNTMDVAEIAQGHNSAFVDDDGRAYVIYHTKFNDGTYGHTVRVHELFLNEDGWLIAAPYEYSGETTLGATASYTKGDNNKYTITTTDYKATSWSNDDVVGDYQLLVHKYKVDHANYEVVEPINIKLNTNGTITGDMSGSWAWSAKGQPYITVTVGGTAYKGVFTNQVIDGSTAVTLCFTAMDAKSGVNIWGTKKITDNIAVAKNAVNFSAIIPKNTFTDIELSTKTTDEVVVTWLSSNEDIISTTGKVTAPSVDTSVTLTARLSKGNYYYDKVYTTTVKAGGDSSADIQTGLVANYDFEGDEFLNKVNSNQHGVAMALSAGTKPTVEYNGEQGSNVLHQYFGYADANSTSYVQFSNPLQGENINGTTVSLWVNRLDTDTFDAIWSFFDEDNTDNINGRVYLTPNAYLGFNGTGGWFDCNHPNNVITNKITVNDWNLVTVTIDTNGFGIYINGELIYTQSINEAFGKSDDFTTYQSVLNIIKSSANFYLGYGSWWGSAPLLMDNLKIYSRALTEVDVAKLYAAERTEIKENLEASTDGYIYYQDYSKITASTIKNVWLSGSAQSNITLTKNDKVYGNYMTFTQPASDSGNRSAISSFGTEVQGLENYTIETDISLRSGNVANRSQSQFVIMGTDTDVNASSNGISSKGYILSLSTNSYNGSNGTEWYLNGDTTNPITIPADQWIHIKASVDKNKKVVMVDITKDGESLYSGTVGINGTGILSGLYILSGRGNGLTKIDNTIVKTSLSDGIIAEYLFDNNLKDSINEEKEAKIIATSDATKSEIVKDSSRGNVMEMKGEWQATGYLSLDTDYLDFITDAFSVSMWAKVNNSKTAGLDPDVKNCGKSTGLFNFKTKENSMGFCALDVSLHPWINDGNGNYLDRKSEDIGLSDSIWKQVIMTMDFTNERICVYIDGVLVEQIETLGGGSFNDLLKAIKSSYDIQIGTLLPWWDTWDFRGYVDDVRLYNKVLTEADAKELYQLPSDKTVLAKNNYIIAFDANGGTGTMQEMSCSIGSKYTLKQNTFVRSEYTFMGWSTTKDGEAVYNDKSEIINLTNTVGSTITLYAVWMSEAILNANLEEGLIAEYLFDENLIDNKNTNLSATIVSSSDDTKSKIVADADRGNVMEMRGEWQATGYLSLDKLYLDWIKDSFSVSMWAKATNSKTSSQDTDENISSCIGSEGLFNFKTVDTVFNANGYQPGEYGFCGLDVSLHPWINDGKGNYLDRKSDKVALSNTEWQQITMTMDFANQKICVYINGILAETITALNGGNFGDLLTSIKNAYDIQIGTLCPWWNVWDFRGYVDDVRLYNKALTEAEAIALYLKTKKDTPITTTINDPYKYSVKFNANGGSGTEIIQEFIYNEEKALAENTYIKEGYSFIGWAKTASGDVIYTDKEKVKSLTKENGGEITLYAIWEKTICTHETTETRDEKEADCTTDGYTGDVYCTNCGELIEEGTLIAALGHDYSTVTYANNAIIISCSKCDSVRKVTLETEEGSIGSNYKPESTTENSILLPAGDTITKLGYTLKGWSDTASGDVKYQGEAEYSKLFSTSDTITLYAIWETIEGPSGTITIANTKWDSFLTAITFGIYKSTQEEITIDAQAQNGIKAIHYIIAIDGMTYTEAQLAALPETDWIVYNSASKPKLQKNTKNVVYAKLEDNAGNISYISSNGIVEDEIVPNITEFDVITGELTDSSASLSAKADKEGTYYFVLCKDSEDDLSDKSGSDLASAIVAKATKSGAMTAEQMVIITEKGLEKATNYNAYITIRDAAGNTSSRVCYFTTAQAMLELTNPTITGSVVYNSDLVADAKNKENLEDYSYQWYRSSSPITGDTNISSLELIGKAVRGEYTIQREDIGKYIAVTIALAHETYAGSCRAYTTEPVQPKTVTAVVSIKEKEYDGKTDAEISEIALDGIVAKDQDQVTAIAGTAIFADAEAGNDKEVIVSNIGLTGQYASCYQLEQSTIKTVGNIIKAKVAPNMPNAENVWNVSRNITKVSDITLPTDWIWLAEDAEKELPIETVVKVTAVYNGKDKGNYEIESVEINIQRSSCTHAETEIRNEKQATCTEAGYSGDTYCKICEQLVSAGNTIAALGHSFTDYKENGDATCTEDGTKTAKCERCDETKTIISEGSKKGHTIVTDPAVEPSCIGIGKTEGKHCSACGEILEEQKGIAALGHDYTSEVTKKPTVTETGIRTYTCSRCDDSYTEEIPKLPEEEHEHQYTKNITKEPTCTVEGVTSYVCSCGDQYTEAIKALGHNYNMVITKPATTTETGIKTFTCTRCDDSYTEEIPKLSEGHEHKYTESITKEPTCTEAGVKTFVCDCGEKYTEEIEALGHDYEVVITKPATVTEAGIKTYTCSRCDDSYTEEIPKLSEEHEHKYTEKITKEATCTEEGVKTFTCSCDEEYTEAIKALGHDYKSEITKPATLAETGIETFTCSRCNDSYTKEIPKLTQPLPPSGNTGSNGGSSGGTTGTTGNNNNNTQTNDTNTGDTDNTGTTQKPEDTSNETPDQTVITETKPDGTVVETVKEEQPDGTKVEKVTETKPNGTVISTATETKTDGSVTSTKEIQLEDKSASLFTIVETTANGNVNVNSVIRTGISDTSDTVNISEELLKDVAEDERLNSIIVEITDTTVNSATKENKKTIVNVNIPSVEGVAVEKVVLTKDSIEAAKNTGKGLVINVTNGCADKGTINNYKVTIPAKQLAKIDSNIQEINVEIIAEPVTNVSNVSKKNAITKIVNKNKGKEKKTCVVSLASNENVKAGMNVTIPVTDKTKITKGSKVYVYKYNAKTGKLVETANCKKTVSKDGTVTIAASSGKDYVISAKKLSGNKVQTIKDSISMSISKKTAKAGKIINVKISLPDTVSTKSKFGTEKATITYKSSDSKVASVSKSGVITTKKKGTVIVTAAVKLASGQKVTKKQEITIK